MVINVDALQFSVSDVKPVSVNFTYELCYILEGMPHG